MQFKHPEILYALLLLLIPIVVHLFQLRRFEKVPFTNVEFLKNVTIQTRKSRQLKKWLTLLTRLLLLAAVIFAFAQPFTSETKGLDTEVETVIYLDNSFSMQAKGDKGELLKRAVQDIISTIDDTQELSIYTNTDVFRNVTTKSVKNDLLQLEYSGNQLPYNATVLKGKKLFSKNKKSIKNLILVSDFQQNNSTFAIDNDSLTKIHFVQLKPVATNNVSIDSAYISSINASSIELRVKASSNANGTFPISLYNGTDLVSKTSIPENSSEATFTLPNNSKFEGRLSVDDAALGFDNSLYFNINERKQTHVLSINEAPDNFLERIFTKDEFDYEAVPFNQLNYNNIDEKSLIILNEIKNIPVALVNALEAYINNDGYLLIIPSNKGNLNSYNQLFTKLSNARFSALSSSEKRVTTINYSHPLFEDVFDKQVDNFQYPKVNTFYNVSQNSSPILQYEDGQPFLIQNNNVFIFTSALNSENSNVVNSPLIVPTLYNIGRQSFKLPKLYFTIGEENNFDVNTILGQDDILKLKLNDQNIIPQQRTLPSKVTITTNDMPLKSGIYTIVNKLENLGQVSYNYNRKESQLQYHTLDNNPNYTVNNSIPDIIDSIKSATNINALWKWFAIFALLFLIIEMLILKYIK